MVISTPNNFTPKQATIAQQATKPLKIGYRCGKKVFNNIVPMDRAIDVMMPHIGTSSTARAIGTGIVLSAGLAVASPVGVVVGTLVGAGTTVISATNSVAKSIANVTGLRNKDTSDVKLLAKAIRDALPKERNNKDLQEALKNLSNHLSLSDPEESCITRNLNTCYSYHTREAYSTVAKKLGATDDNMAEAKEWIKNKIRSSTQTLN